MSRSDPTGKQFEALEWVRGTISRGDIPTVSGMARAFSISWRAAHERTAGLVSRGYCAFAEGRSGILMLRDRWARRVIRWDMIVEDAGK